jgi:hypothetical protein
MSIIVEVWKVIQMERENRKKDKVMHGIIFILVIILGMLLTVSVNRDQRENKIKLAVLEMRVENLETWTDEVEKNGINIK